MSFDLILPFLNSGQCLSGVLVPLTLIIQSLLIVSKRSVDVVLECHLFIIMLLGIEKTQKHQIYVLAQSPIVVPLLLSSHHRYLMNALVLLLRDLPL